MPIPLLVGLGVAALGLYGAKKGLDAKDNNDKAKDLRDEAESIYNEAKENLEQQRSDTNDMLEKLGATRLNLWAGDLGHFVKAFKKFKNVSWEGNIAEDKFLNNSIESIENIEATTMKAGEIVSAGMGSLAAGGLAGIAAYGGTMMLATASTGTAISALSGAAAANATLAWLGGGSLAAGGLGIAGGTMVLGGIVAGPIIAVAGTFMAAKSEENLAKARKMHSEATEAAEKMDTMSDALKNIHSLASDYNNFILKFSMRFRPLIDQMEVVYSNSYERQSKSVKNRIKSLFGVGFQVDFSKLTQEEKRVLHISWIMAQSLHKLLSKNLIDGEGNADNTAKQLLVEYKDNDIQKIAAYE